MAKFASTSFPGRQTRFRSSGLWEIGSCSSDVIGFSLFRVGLGAKEVTIDTIALSGCGFDDRGLSSHILRHSTQSRFSTEAKRLCILMVTGINKLKLGLVEGSWLCVRDHTLFPSPSFAAGNI